MGFLRQLFGGKKSPSSGDGNSGGNDPKSHGKGNRKWNFGRSQNEKNPATSSNHPNTTVSRYGGNFDANKHAIAVAAATAAVAEAALAAAHAAAQVVRLTSGGGVRGRCGTVGHGGGANHWWLKVMAAVKIQAAFRGYLARRARRALRALVKLQALVRGHIVRKRTADMLRRIQTLVRLQARACASRSHTTGSLRFSNNSFLSRHPVLESPEKNEHRLRTYRTKVEESSAIKRSSSNSNFRDTINLEKARPGSNWLDHWMEESLWNRRDTAKKNWHFDDGRSDKILEVDTWKPRANSQQSKKTFQTSHNVSASDYKNQDFMTYDSPSRYSNKAPRPVPSPSLSSVEALSFSSVNFPLGADELALRTEENSPQVFSASSRPGSSARKGPFTPSKSECSWGYFNGYSAHPNYMANTECSRAKVRSQSAPRQRLEFEKQSSTKRLVHGFWDDGTNSERSFALHSDLKNKTYRVSSYLNRPGSTNLR